MGNKIMGYKYDVFLSYKRGRPFGEWTQKHFYPEFKGILAEALGREDVKIFVDTGEISSGDTLPPRIKSAIAHSRCLVAIWTPLYFTSGWCQRELSVMLKRERLLGYRTAERPEGLIIPIKVFDGDRFPRFTNNIFQRDFSEYAVLGEGFFKTEKYVNFQFAVRDFSFEVAKAIENSPIWRKEWIEDLTFNDLINEDFSISYGVPFPDLDIW
jgi:hypothetical protein